MGHAAGAEKKLETPRDRHRRLMEVAARLICEKGYEGTSIQDIAAAGGLTKAGLYHHIRSKEHLLLEIMNYGMDVFEEAFRPRSWRIETRVKPLKPAMGRTI